MTNLPENDLALDAGASTIAPQHQLLVQENTLGIPKIQGIKGDKLVGKTALITGGTSGIGLATAVLFLEHGANVIVTGRNQNKLTTAIKQFRQIGATVLSEEDGVISENRLCNGGYVSVLKNDSGAISEIDSLVASVKKNFSTLDILFLNAGVANPKQFSDITEEDFDHILNVNFKGIFFTIQKMYHLLNNNSSIVVTTSIANLRCNQLFLAYGASKAAIAFAVKILARTFIDKKVRVNAVSPGPIGTEGLLSMDLPPELLEEKINELKQRTAFGEIGEPIDIANAVLFLASSEAKFINGEEIVVDCAASAKV